MIPVVLGFFEAFVHTIGIFIHKMKKPYTPGLVSAWIMAAGAIYTIYYLEANELVGVGDYVLGTILMFGGFLLMDLRVLRSVAMSIKDVAVKAKTMRNQHK